MNTILQFLKMEFDKEIEGSGRMMIGSNDLIKINKLFTEARSNTHISHNIKLKPSIRKNQIWSVKKEYYDFLGIKQSVSIPLLIIVKTEPGDIQEEPFVRINVISPFLEFASSDDLVCNDASVIGFPFLIESWNDQPILTEILDEYLGYYEIERENNRGEEIGESIKLNNLQKEFRELEVAKAKHLNNSISSLLVFLENYQSQDCGVVISILNSSEFPKFYVGQNQQDSSYALAAKSLLDNEDKYIEYEQANLPYRIFIRKKYTGFVISVITKENIKLFDYYNEEIQGSKDKDKVVFDKLEKGLYFLKSEQVIEPVKIRIK